MERVAIIGGGLEQPPELAWPRDKYMPLTTRKRDGSRQKHSYTESVDTWSPAVIHPPMSIGTGCDDGLQFAVRSLIDKLQTIHKQHTTACSFYYLYSFSLQNPSLYLQFIIKEISAPPLHLLSVIISCYYVGTHFLLQQYS